MNLVYIQTGHYSGFKDVLRCAQARAGCPITVIPNPESYKSWNYVFAFKAYSTSPWNAFGIARWFVLREMLQTGMIKLPVFCSDWDILLFSNLRAAYEPFSNYDFAVSIDNNINSAAYCVNSIEALNVFCDIIASIYSNRPDEAMNDMAAWSSVIATGKFKVGNMFEIVNGTVFDHNIVCGRERFQMSHGVKRIEWHYGSPFFIALDGKLIKAHSLHCWGPFKTKTSELIAKAGIT